MRRLKKILGATFMVVPVQFVTVYTLVNSGVGGYDACKVSAVFGLLFLLGLDLYLEFRNEQT